MNVFIYKRMRQSTIVLLALFFVLYAKATIITIGDWEYDGTACTGYLGSADAITIPISYVYEGEKITVKVVGRLGGMGSGSTFNTCKAAKITIPIASISDTFHDNEYLKEVILDVERPWIMYSFHDCINLEKVVFTEKMSELALQNAFQRCPSLKEIYMLNPTPPIYKSTFFIDSEVKKNATLYVPKGCKTAYEAAGWNVFKEIVEIGEEDKSNIFIDNGLRYQIIGQEDVAVLGPEQNSIAQCDIPNQVIYEETTYNVTTIMAGAFGNCGALSRITLPNSLVKIGNEAFKACKSLKTITIPVSVKSFHYNVFTDCSSLKAVEVDVNHTSFSSVDGVLYNVDKSNLIFCPANYPKKIFKPEHNLKSISSYALHECRNIEEIVFPDGLIQIGELAISSCDKLKSVTIPSSLVDLNKDIFGDYKEQGAFKELHCQNALIPPTCSDIVFAKMNINTMTLFVPNYEAKKVYRKIVPWNRFKYILKEGECIAFTWSNFTFGYVSESDRTIEVIACEDHTIFDYEIPETIERNGIIYTVVGIGEGAFDGCTHINTITLPTTLKEIKDEAFANCNGLTAVYFKSTQHPTLGKDVFENVDLQKITAYVPQGCKKHYTDWDVFVKVVEEGDVVLGTKFTDEAGFFQCCVLSGNTVSVVGPDIEDGSTWTVTECTIPVTVSHDDKTYNVITIGESAFYGCDKLVKITLPDGLKTISKNAFKHCYALTSIDIPASVETIGQYAFDMDEMLTQVTLHEGLKEIGEGAFDECGVKEITIPASVTLMGYVEEGWNNPYIGILERINVQPGNTVYASVDGILYNKAKTILMHCPTDYPVKNVTLPAGIIRIVDNAMEHCGFIESIVLPEGLEVIEIGAFEYCDALKSITIPSTLKEAGTYLFGTPYTEDDFCALQEIHSNHKAPGNIKMDGDPLATINKNTCTLYVPKGTKALYEAAPGWKDFKNIVEEGGGTAVQSFTIGQLQYKVTAANEVMITGVTDKTPEYFDIKPSVTYEGTTYNVTAVGERAFYECSNLVRFQPERVKMPLKTIGKEAFLACGKLTNLLLGSTLETIGDGAFIQCSSLQNIEIPAGVASIGEGVFDECVKLAHIAVNSANRHYTSSNGALYNKDKTILLVCPNMRGDSYIIPNSVKRIESGAFYYCTNLKSVTLPDGLESIGDCAFDFCI